MRSSSDGADWTHSSGVAKVTTAKSIWASSKALVRQSRLKHRLSMSPTLRGGSSATVVDSSFGEASRDGSGRADVSFSTGSLLDWDYSLVYWAVTAAE